MSQNALVLRKIGTPLMLESRPIPVPKEHEVLLKVATAGRGSWLSLYHVLFLLVMAYGYIQAKILLNQSILTTRKSGI